LLKFIRNYII